MKSPPIAPEHPLKSLKARLSAALGGLSTANLTDQLAAVRGTAEAIVLDRPLDVAGFEQGEWTYADVADFVARAAACLHHDAGVQPGHVVAVCTSNALDMPLLLLAVLRLGATAVPLNHQMRADEIRFIVRDCGATVLIADRTIEAEVHALCQHDGPNNPLQHVVWAPDAPPDVLEPPIDGAVSFHALTSRLTDALPEPPAATADPDAVCAIFCTSGTTGFPKGAMLTSRSLLDSFRWLLLLPPWPRFDALLALPIAHIMGFAAFIGFLVSGLRIHFFEKFDAHRVLDALEGEDIDGFIGVPSMYQLLANAGAAERDLRGVRVFASAADVMPGHLIAAFKHAGQTFGRVAGAPPIPATFVEVYGSVELSGAAMVRISLPWVSPSIDGFVGLPLPGYRARVLGPDGAELSRGQTGELFIRGPGVFKGYLTEPSAPAEGASVGPSEPGWLRTGDLAQRTRLGFVRFVGRDKDVIKTGGYSVFPAELETRLLLHPDIIKAAVVGVPHPTRGATPIAVVCLRPGAEPDDEAILRWLQSHVARYKAPRRVVIIDPDQMPYGATGKIEKRLLRERFKDLLHP